MPGKEVCTIRNNHSEDSGHPPEIQFEDYDYVSYFENAHGEQSFFLYDADTEEIIVYLADAGWNNPQVLPAKWVVNNTLPDQEFEMGILPSSSEKMWLKACKEAVCPRISNHSH